MEFKFTLINNWSTIFSEEFRDKWTEYFQASKNKNIFMHPALNIAWLNTYIKIYKIEPFFILAEKDSRKVFFPLVLWKRNWKNLFKKLLVPVGNSDFDYNEPYLLNDFSADEIDLFFNDLLLFLKLEKIYYDSVEISGLRETFFNSVIFKSNEFSCPIIRLEENSTFEEYLQYLPKKLKKDIRRRTNKLQQIGDLDFVRIYDAKEALIFLPNFLEMYRKRRPNAFIPEGFHENLINECCKNNLIEFSMLMLNNKPISIRIAFILDNTYYSYLPVLDTNYSKYSIGNIHRLDTLRNAYDEDYIIYDMLRGNKKYKEKWAFEEVMMNSFYSLSNKLSSKGKNFFFKVKFRILR